MKKFLVLFLLICSMVSAQPATPKYGQNIPPGGVLGFYPGDGKFYSLPLNASGALLVDSGEVPLWGLNASGVVETLGNRAIDALSLQLSSDGTAAAPSISFGSDPDTGIYRYGANSLGFGVNGYNAMRIGTTGSYHNGTFYFSSYDAENNGYISGANGVTTWEFQSDARPISLNAAGNNVLIGTTTDDGANKLQVNGNIKTNRLYYEPSSIPVFADDAAAKAGGYNVPGATYRTSTGALMMVLP